MAKTVCDLLHWRRPNGGLKAHESRLFLDELGERGMLVLPAGQTTHPRGRRTTVPVTAQGGEQPELVGTVRGAVPVTVALVADEAERRLWRELVGRHHYPGHKMPFGASLRYLVRGERPESAVVGCLQFSSPAWRMAARDRWVCWDDGSLRQQHAAHPVCPVQRHPRSRVPKRSRAARLGPQVMRQIGNAPFEKDQK